MSHTMIRLARLASVFLAAASLPATADEPPRVSGYAIVDGRAIPESLTGAPGSPAAGRALYADPSAGRCADCHGMPGDGRSPTAAPDLTGLAGRLTPGAVRLWIVAPAVLAPGTAMPAFHAAGQRRDPSDPRFGEPWLSAGEIEDIIAYLLAPGDVR